MTLISPKIPFLIELLFNGSFILLYSLNKYKKFPLPFAPHLVEQFLSASIWFVPLIILGITILQYLKIKDIYEFFRRHIFSLIVLLPLFITWGQIEFAFLLSTAHLLSTLLSLYDSSGGVERTELFPNTNSKNFWQRLNPAQIVLLTFAVLIFAGTFLLMLPVSAAPGKSISFIDAFFISTSAACVTGLATVQVGEVFSLFGQLVVLVLIQVGGLGIMTLSTSLTIFLGRSMAIRERLRIQDVLDASSLADLYRIVVDIIKFTFFIELWGGIVLSAAFSFEGLEFGKAIYYGFFHSVSAFCNAGFSLFSNNLENFSTNPLINFTICILIIAGGLGFVVLKEISMIVSERKSFKLFSVHSKIVLVTSGLLILLGTAVIFFSEFLYGLDSYSLWDKLQISIFQSVTLRTAGYNTINLATFQAHTVYIMILLMFIGGSPGSTAGGIKTTTFAILLKSIGSILQGSEDVTFFDRKIPSNTVVKSTALTMMSIILTSIFIFFLMQVEREQSFLSLVFEAISAFGTVGLSLGITGYLSSWGKLVIIALMFIGRVGPLTLVFSIGSRDKGANLVQYPDGRVMIG